MAKKNSGIFIEWGMLDPYLFGLRIDFFYFHRFSNEETYKIGLND